MICQSTCLWTLPFLIISRTKVVLNKARTRIRPQQPKTRDTQLATIAKFTRLKIKTIRSSVITIDPKLLIMLETVRTTSATKMEPKASRSLLEITTSTKTIRIKKEVARTSKIVVEALKKSRKGQVHRMLSPSMCRSSKNSILKASKTNSNHSSNSSSNMLRNRKKRKSAMATKKIKVRCTIRRSKTRMVGKKRHLSRFSSPRANSLLLMHNKMPHSSKFYAQMSQSLELYAVINFSHFLRFSYHGVLSTCVLSFLPVFFLNAL